MNNKFICPKCKRIGLPSTYFTNVICTNCANKKRFKDYIEPQIVKIETFKRNKK